MNEKKDEATKYILNSGPKWNKLYFHVDEIVIQCGKLQLKLPEFWDLEHVDEIAFVFGDKKHVYRKEKVKHG